MVLKCKYKIKEILNFSTFIKKQIISEVTIMKKKLLIVALVAVMTTTSSLAFSGCGKETDSTPVEAASTSVEPTSSPVEPTSTSVEPTLTVEETTLAKEVATFKTVPADKVDAIKDKKLKVSKDGKIVDDKGKVVKPNKKGEVEIATKDGKKVKITADEVEAVNSGSYEVVTTAPKEFNSNKPSSKKNNSNSQKSNSNNKKSNSNNKKNNSNNKKSNTNKGNTNGGNSTAKPAPKPVQKPAPKPAPKPAEKPADPKPADPKPAPKPTEREKVWVVDYKTVHHPAEPAVTKTVHHDAVTHEEPVYKWVGYHICNQCGARLNDFNEVAEHFDSDTCVSYKTCKEKVQVGTETVVDTPAWDEEIVVTPAKKAWDETVEDGGHWEYK